MSRRAGVAAIGVATVVVAWQLGSIPFAVAGLGALLAAGVAWGWERRIRGLVLTRDLPAGPFVEGDELRYQARLLGARLPGSYVLTETVSHSQILRSTLHRTGPTQVVIPELRRGRLRFLHATLTADDPLGVTRLTRELDTGPSLLVRPRIPLLATVFNEGGARLGSGRKRAVAGPSGLELRGVREYRDGEPLRTVHWVSTARRGRLMVRELEEPPHHDTTVLLDLDGAAEVGPSGATSLDEAVRAAGALLRAQLERGRAARLVVAGSQEETAVVRSLHEWDDALDLLAAAEPRRENDWTYIGDAAGRTILVTARADLAGIASDDVVAVVYVDARTYGGQPPSPAVPGLVRLAARGVPVAVMRHGDSLKSVLEGAMPAGQAATRG